MPGGEGILGVSSAAIRWDGRLWTWGRNSTGWLATGTPADAAKPTLVPNLTDVSQFALNITGGVFDEGFSLAVGTLAGTVPSLIGDTLAHAGAVLAAAGLTLGTVSYSLRLHLRHQRAREIPEPVRGDLRPVRLGGLGHDRESPAAAFSMSLTSRCASAQGTCQDLISPARNRQGRLPVSMEGARYPAFPAG
jgi:hypothetical protein